MDECSLTYVPLSCTKCNKSKYTLHNFSIVVGIINDIRLDDTQYKLGTCFKTTRTTAYPEITISQ